MLVLIMQYFKTHYTLVFFLPFKFVFVFMFFYLYIWSVTNDKFDAGACQELNSIDAGVCEPG